MLQQSRINGYCWCIWTLASTPPQQLLLQLLLHQEQLQEHNNCTNCTSCCTNDSCTTVAGTNTYNDCCTRNCICSYDCCTGTITSDATVKGQLESLQNEVSTALASGNPLPVWARGAAKATEAAMANRGLSASSMAAEALAEGIMNLLYQ